MTRPTPALLLIDFQNEFLRRPALAPSADAVVATARGVLEHCRSHHLPVLHVHTVTSPDGANRMPHWIDAQYSGCVEGSEGAACPPALAPAPGETIVTKQFYSGFESGHLHPALQRLGVDTLLVAGLYAHACVRSTVLDAYAKGYRITIIEDALASPEAEHTRLSNAWLHGRAATFASAAEVLSKLTAGGRPQP